MERFGGCACLGEPLTAVAAPVRGGYLVQEELLCVSVVCLHELLRAVWVGGVSWRREFREGGLGALKKFGGRLFWGDV